MDSSTLESAESWLAAIWWVKLAAAGLVALGVAMEFGGDWVAAPFEKIVANARKLEIAKLTTEAETAKGEIAKSNERAGQLEKDTEAAKQETERLKVQASWRELKPDEANKFVNALKGQTLSMAYAGDDPERIEYARMFAKALNDAKLLSGFGGGGKLPEHPPGLSVGGVDSNAKQTVISALSAAGLKATLLPNSSSSIGGVVTLYVGPKPRPEL